MAKEIAAGRWRPGEFLPTEVLLCARHGVARLTLRRALQILVDGGRIRRLPHRGLLVNHADGVPAEAPPVRRRGRGVRAARLLIATIAMTAPDEGMDRIQVGIEEYCRAHGLGYQIIGSSAGPADLPFLIDPLPSIGVHGAIILPHPGPDPTPSILPLRRRGFPLVCVEQRSRDAGISSVEVDNRAGMYRAVQHLITTHRRPVWYLGLRAAHAADASRQEGYRLAMRDAGYGAEAAEMTILHAMDTADPAYWHVEDPWLQGYEVAERLFSRPGHTWSVACQKDHIAWGLYRAAQERGLAIGQRVLVTGFDDLAIATLLQPGLTTIRQSFHLKGWKAAWLLHQEIIGNTPGGIQVMLPTELVIRGSA